MDLTWSNSNLCLTVGYEKYRYIVDLNRFPKKVVATPHLQHVLMGKDASHHYPLFPVIGNNSQNTGQCNASPNLSEDSSTSSSYMSNAEAEIYVGNMSEKDGKVYKVKTVDHKKGQVTCAIFGQQNNLAYNGKDAKMKHKHLWHMFKLNESIENTVNEHS